MESKYPFGGASVIVIQVDTEDVSHVRDHDSLMITSLELYVAKYIVMLEGSPLDYLVQPRG